MILWRIARAPFADLTGEGARRFGGRWNRPGRAVVYLAEHPALAMLEVLVHLDLPRDMMPDDYVLMQVETPDIPFAELALPDSRAEPEIGEEWLVAGAAALLRVPSVLAPHSFNWLLNPAQADAAAVRIVSVEPLTFDDRLLA